MGQKYQPAMLGDQQDFVNILYYGDGGTGKTTDLAHLANKGRVLMVNAESGIKARPLKNLGVDISNIELFPRPGQDLTYDSLEAEFIRVKQALDADPTSYVGIIWDSLTEIYQKLLNNIVDEAYAKAQRIGKDRDPFFIDRSDYGVMTQQVRILIRNYRDLPCHFGVSALERRDVDDDGSVKYGPSMSPALANDVFGYMDLVVHTSQQDIGGEVEFVGAFQPYSKYRAKDRFGVFPRKMVDPTYDRVIDYVTGDLTADDDPVMQATRERAKTAAEKAAASEAA